MEKMVYILITIWLNLFLDDINIRNYLELFDSLEIIVFLIFKTINIL